MDYVYMDFRNALTILQSRVAWSDLESAIHSLTPTAILDRHKRMVDARAADGKGPPAGGQTAVNATFDELLPEVNGWTHQPRLFRSRELEKWKMDFLRQGIGIEVSFNHAEAIPWQFTRLNVAGESERVLPAAQIDVGVVICATRSFKTWARMDSSVGTFDTFKAWLREMRPILPVPILLIGLDATGWPATDAFRGTSKGTRTAIGAPAVLLPANDDGG